MNTDEEKGRADGGPRHGAEARGKAHLFVISAPSGAGKTTLRRALLKRFPQMFYSVSATTRPPRPEERDGREYEFLTRAAFEEGIRLGRWAEWALVHGNYYGTSAETLGRVLDGGRDVLLEIDVQGARQICARFPDSVTVFILPPSLEVLRQRLAARGTESPEAVAVRLSNAERELAQQGFYRHVIVNDDLDRATRELIALIDSYRGRA
jgi:guanylate kinase